MQNASGSFTVLDFKIEHRRAYAFPQPHAHNDIEIVFVTKGWLEHSMGGRDVRFTAGKCAFFWAGIPHRCQATSPSSKIFLVHLPLAWFLGWSLPTDLLRRLLGGEIIEPQTGDPDALENSFLRWKSDQEELGGSWKSVVLLELQAFFLRHELRSRKPGESVKTAAAEHSSVSAKILRHLVEHSAEKVSSTDIAAATGVHPNHAMRVFKEAFGLSIWTLLIQMRLMHAERLLVLTERKVVDIAYEVGFGSVGHFYTTFFARFQCSPKLYRLQATESRHER
jgi:AraC-like DNA-binding protein